MQPHLTKVYASLAFLSNCRREVSVPAPMSVVGHLRHFERPPETSAIPPIATKNGEPLERRRANGNNFSNRFPQIVAALTVLPVRSCLIDGEAIVCNGDGLAVFDLIRKYRHDGAAVLCAFDLLEVDGEDLRRMPIEQRKGVLAKLLSRPHAGIAFNQHSEADGPIIYKHACALGCEGIVSKRLGSSYRSGRADCWVKLKNPAAPAVTREAEEEWN